MERKENNDNNYTLKSSDILGEVDVDIKVRMSLEDLRILSRYLEGDLLTELDETVLRTEEVDSMVEKDYYNRIREIVEVVANGIYKGLIDTEKVVIDELKRRDISKDEILELMTKDEYDRERIENIYRAMDEMNQEEEEAKEIFDKIDIYGKMVLSKLKESAGEELYLPLIYKFYWMLYNSMDKSGELVFTENSIEELLNLDREGVEGFLDIMSGIEVQMGNKRGRVIEYYSYLNDSTLKIEYNVFTVNPRRYTGMDREFNIGKPEDVEVRFVN